MAGPLGGQTTERPRTEDIQAQAIRITTQGLNTVFQRPELAQLFQNASPSQLDSLARSAAQRMPDGSIGNRQQFVDTLTQIAPRMSEERKEQIWLLLNQSLTPILDNAINSAIASRPARMTDEEWQRSDIRQRAVALQTYSASTCHHRYQAGERDESGTPRLEGDMQKDSLIRMGQGLTPQQQSDMFGGAAQAGYSAAAIYAVQLHFQEEELRSRNPQSRGDDFDEAMISAQTSLRLSIQQTMQQRLQELQTAQRDARLKDPEDPQVIAERESAIAGVARLMGGTPSKFKQVRNEDADTIVSTVFAQVEGQRAIHQHQLDQVVPRLVG